MIYKLRMVTQNPSADKSGYFETEEEVENTIKVWRGIVDEDLKRPQEEQYYGRTEFYTDKIFTGAKYFD